MLRAIPYARVSKVGERGDDLISPDLQLHSMQVWAERNGVALLDPIIDLDESGRSFEKRSVRGMIERIQAGEADMVLVWKWSRWGRNVLESRIYIAAVEKAGGQVRASEEDFDPTHTMGKFTRDQMLLIAELQSNQISDAWKDTHAKRRREGLPHTSSPRFGYVYDKGEGYTLDPATAPVLQSLYRQALGGVPMRALARSMNERGHFTVAGNQWTPTSLGRMLDTGFAAGLIRERSNPPKAGNNKNSIAQFDIWREGAHEAAISMDTWEAYRDARLARTLPQSRRGRTHPLTGLLVCGVCDAPLWAQSARRAHRGFSWVCSARARERSKGGQGHAPVTISDLRAMAVVERWLEEEGEEAGDLERRVATKEAARVAAQSNTAALEARLTDLKGQRLNLSRQLTKGRVTEDEFDVLAAELDAAIVQAQAAASKARVVPSQAPTRAMYEGVLAGMRVATGEESQALLATVVRSVVVAPGPFNDDKLSVVPAWA